jgi:hypothetical protein
METHVKVLAVVQIVCSALGVMGALVLMLIFGGTVGIVGASGDPDAALAIPIIGITGVAVVVFLLVLSLPGIVVGIGLLQRRSWARVGGIVLSVFNLFGFPFLTLLGIYGLWVLFSKETERLFVPSTDPALVK